MAGGTIYYYYNPVTDKYCRRTQLNQKKTASRDSFKWKGLGMLIERHQRKIEMLMVGYTPDIFRITGVGVMRTTLAHKGLRLIGLHNERFVKNYEYTPESEG